MATRSIKNILASQEFGQSLKVQGWVRAFRSNRFIALNDGSTQANLQLVIDFTQFDESLIRRISVGAALEAEGLLVSSQGSGQTMELQITKLDILGDCDPSSYPLQPKNTAWNS